MLLVMGKNEGLCLYMSPVSHMEQYILSVKKNIYKFYHGASNQVLSRRDGPLTEHLLHEMALGVGTPARERIYS